MIAKFHENEGVCLDGRWKGWLFKRHPDGQWVSVRKLDLESPAESHTLGHILNSHLAKPVATAAMVKAAKSAYWSEVHHGGGYSDKCYSVAIEAALKTQIDADVSQSAAA